MRALLIAVCALAFVPPALSAATLKITVWPQGKEGPFTTWTLRCAPAGGTHPDAAAACGALARHPRALRPVPKELNCTQQWDGPQVALVRGTFRGKRVKSWFRRTGGCESGRWNALAALFPVQTR